MSEKLPDGWKRVKLGEVVEKIGDGLHGTPKFDDNGDYYFINGNNLENGRIVIKKETKKINKIEFDKYQKPLSENTILVGINGTIGNLALYNGEKCILGKSVCYINVSSKVNKRFLYYNFLNKDFQYFLTEIATGTTILNVPLKSIKEYSFSLPPLHEQKAISGILSSLDDKIDLLHRQNKTLEEMAQTLFRKWFIEDAQEDWEEVSLGDIVEIKYGKNLPTSKLGTEGYPVFGGSGIIGYYINYLYEEPQVLVSCRGSGSGKVIISEPYSFITNNSFILERSKNDWFSFEFLKYWALNYDFSPYISGSAQPQITINDLFDASIILPKDKTIIRRFSILTKPIEEKILKNKLQIRTLEQLRDTLLPKLMSGEVRVKL
jgi:type I restriction enzyme S subunit